MPTQVKQPGRTTVRSVFQAIIALAVMAPVLVQTTGLDPESLPWLAGVLAVLAALVRVMALPQVEDFLRSYVPWLAAQPAAIRHRFDERGAVETRVIAVLALIGVVILGLFWIFGINLSVRG